jgi:hypothetical protein
MYVVANCLSKAVIMVDDIFVDDDNFSTGLVSVIARQ